MSLVVAIFLSRRAKYLSDDKERNLIEGVLMEKVEQEYRESMNVAFTWKRLFLEMFLIGERSIF